jgi:hypothetical protein
MRTTMIAAGLALSMALAHPAIAVPARIATPDFSVSGAMTPNADGTASFEFRAANDRADITVTGFTVTVVFYDREVASGRKLAEYRWSFVSEVPPKSQLLEYGVLGEKAVAGLLKRHAIAAGQAKTDPLATAVYTYDAKIDGQSAAPKN